ncbi:hypothetical protein P43SY_003025 [Pythium insidiosum]|uniref:Cytidyltransferase-like domain-containing protein n=1 Tax=Pythium insidiosum TaxID=114742 RepID=A0AAD5M464_PYTIN|nr:hypothetical protein P43SY_003025 [Pythium insidiosum]
MEHDEATAFAANAKTKGNHYFQRGHWEAAYRQYSNGINAEGPVDPDLLAQLHSNRAATCLHLNRAREARMEAKRATALAPLWPKAHIRLAETYHATRKYDKAASRLETALGLAKESLDSAASREIRNKLDAYRLDRAGYEHGHSQNRSYDPRFVDEDPLSEAFRSQMGLPDDGPSPSAFVDELLQRVPESESTGAQRNVVIGHRARTRGDDVAAAEAFRSAALQGNPEGMYNYAVMLQAGHGVQQNLEESFRWFERAAVCPPNAFAVFPYVGICDAMAALGRCYSLGIVVEKDERKALSELRTLTTPYGHRLRRAKELMIQASEAFEDGDMVACAAYAAEANRIDDAPLVFSPEEVIQSRTAAALLAISGQWDADLALLMYPRDPDRLVGYWMAAHASFPDDPIFRDLHASLAANRPGDQGQYVGVLYSLAAASFHAWDLEEANAQCKSFLARDAMSRKLMTKFSGSSGAMAATTQAVPMRSGSILALAIGVAAVVGVSALHKRRLLRSEGDIAADSAVAGRSDGNASAGGSAAGRQRAAQVAVGLLRLCVPRHWTDLVKNDVFIDKTMAQVAETLIIFVDGHDKHEILNYASELYNMAWDVACVKGKLSLDIRIVAGVAGEGMPTWDALLLLPELNAVFGEEDHVNVQQMNAARLERDGLFAVAYHPLARFAQPYLRAELRYFEDEHTPLTLQDQILLGGTFDHLHNGHKKLLSLAVSVCRRHLIVGITSEAMLRHKANAELIESLETRQRNVLAFVQFLKPSLRVEFAVLEDPFGPAIQVDGPAGLVLSTETLPALPKIESIRRERGLAPLTAYVCRRTDASTLSSSFIRERLAASRMPAPK